MVGMGRRWARVLGLVVGVGAVATPLIIAATTRIVPGPLPAVGIEVESGEVAIVPLIEPEDADLRVTSLVQGVDFIPADLSRGRGGGGTWTVTILQCSGAVSLGVDVRPPTGCQAFNPGAELKSGWSLVAAFSSEDGGATYVPSWTVILEREGRVVRQEVGRPVYVIQVVEHQEGDVYLE